MSLRILSFKLSIFFKQKHFPLFSIESENDKPYFFQSEFLCKIPDPTKVEYDADCKVCAV
jgi:hypothetical protein